MFVDVPFEINPVMAFGEEADHVKVDPVTEADKATEEEAWFSQTV